MSRPRRGHESLQHIRGLRSKSARWIGQRLVSDQILVPDKRSWPDRPEPRIRGSRQADSGNPSVAREPHWDQIREERNEHTKQGLDVPAGNV